MVHTTGCQEVLWYVICTLWNFASLIQSIWRLQNPGKSVTLRQRKKAWEPRGYKTKCESHKAMEPGVLHRKIIAHFSKSHQITQYACSLQTLSDCMVPCPLVYHQSALETTPSDKYQSNAIMVFYIFTALNMMQLSSHNWNTLIFSLGFSFLSLFISSFCPHTNWGFQDFKSWYLFS